MENKNNILIKFTKNGKDSPIYFFLKKVHIMGILFFFCFFFYRTTMGDKRFNIVACSRLNSNSWPLLSEKRSLSSHPSVIVWNPNFYMDINILIELPIF